MTELNSNTATILDTRCYDCNNKPALTQGLCHTCYERMRKRAIASGRWESVRVPMDASLDHIQTLRDMGYSINLIAHLAGVEERTIGRMLRAENAQIELETEERLLSVPIVSLWDLWKTTKHSHRMPSEPATRRLRALASDGWIYSQVGEKLGWETTQVARLALRPSRLVLSGTTRAIDKVFRDPEFAIPTNRARRVILMRKWPTAFEWDDIDTQDLNAEKIAVRRATRRTHRILEERKAEKRVRR